MYEKYLKSFTYRIEFVMKKIGIIGLGLKNPWTYAPLLRQMQATPSFVWDYDRKNAESYAAQFECAVVDTIANFPFSSVDGVIVESRNSDHCALALPFVRKGIPVFIEKPLSHDCDQALSFLKAYSTAPVFSCSPLRFSENYSLMLDEIYRKNNDRILSCGITVLHTMGHFLASEEKRWHDRKAEGGGMLMDIGIHAVELLNMFMKKPVGHVVCTSVRSLYKSAESKDNYAITVRYDDTTIGTIRLLCATQELDYAVEAYGEKSSYVNNRFHTFMNSGGTPEDAYGGFKGTMAAFLEMVETGRSPIDPSETARNFELLKRLNVA